MGDQKMASAADGRELALQTLLVITRDGEYSHIALKKILDEHQDLDKKERAFITRVVNGTLERMIEIDHILNRFSKVKVNKMKPVVRMILRMGVYQLKYMDHVPSSAICNESVKLAARKGFSGLKGFVNGVLRNISRNISRIAEPGKEDMKKYLSVRYSLPEWMVEQWTEEYGEDTVEQIGQAFLEERPLTIRCNLTALGREELIKELEKEGVAAKELVLPCALAISGYDHISKLESFRKGYFYVQDLSSMYVAEWADPPKGAYIIDVCAAPGGKAIHMAEKLSGTGHVQARDLTDYKVGLLKDNIARSRLENIEAVKWDATVRDETAREKADLVIADLPCSGMGVIGRKVDLKYKMTPKLQEDLVKLQRNILSVVHTYVKPGGRLLYSTCTIHRTENEENARWFLKEQPQFCLVREQQMIPGRDSGDGFYIAMFEKQKNL